VIINNDNVYYNILAKANLLTILGAYKDKKYFAGAEKLYIKLNKINPFLPEPHKDWGRMQMYKGDYKKAITIFNLSLSVIPDENNSELNMPEVAEHKNEVNNFRANIYNNMAYSYLKLNNLGDSQEYYKKIINIDPHNLDAHKMIANNYYLSHNLDMAIWYYKRGAMLDPSNSQWYFSLAVIYKERGDKIRAKEYADHTLKLSPENKQIQELIKNLDN
jgi:tetratricopeptide (TPR) repeat protein